MFRPDISGESFVDLGNRFSHAVYPHIVFKILKNHHYFLGSTDCKTGNNSLSAVFYGFFYAFDEFSFSLLSVRMISAGVSTFNNQIIALNRLSSLYQTHVACVNVPGKYGGGVSINLIHRCTRNMSCWIW